MSIGICVPSVNVRSYLLTCLRRQHTLKKLVLETCASHLYKKLARISVNLVQVFSGTSFLHAIEHSSQLCSRSQTVQRDWPASCCCVRNCELASNFSCNFFAQVSCTSFLSACCQHYSTDVAGCCWCASDPVPSAGVSTREAEWRRLNDGQLLAERCRTIRRNRTNPAAKTHSGHHCQGS